MDMKAIMERAQEMQVAMAKKQEELGRRVFEADAGGGMVKVSVNGKRELVKIAIDPSAISADGAEMLEDLIVAAVNEGLRKADEAAHDMMSGMLGGLGGMQNTFG